MVERLSHARQPVRFASPIDDAGDVAQARVLEQRVGGRRAVERHRFGAERFGEAQDIDAPVALAFRQLEQLRRLDRHHEPLGVERIGKALADAHQLFGLAVRRDGDQESIARQPGSRGGRLARELQRRRIHPVGGAAQRELAQRQQVGLAEEALGGRADPVGDIHLAGLEPRQQVVGRQVDQLDFVRFVEYAIRQRLLLTDRP